MSYTSVSTSTSTDIEALQPFLRSRGDRSVPIYDGLPGAPKPLSRSRVLALSSAITLAVWGLLMLLPTSPSSSPSPPTSSLISPAHQTAESNEPLEPQHLTLSATKWTLMPPAHLPLSPTAMARTCAVVQAYHLTHSGGAGHPRYYAADASFVDPVAHAARPPSECKSSLTYVLSSSSSVAGLGESLLEVFGVAGLAAAEGRAFFVDDRNWAWGRWSDYFTTGTAANDAGAACSPPAPEVMLPCPRSAQHLVVAHETRQWVFGHAFTDEYEDARVAGAARQRRIFALLRDGYEKVFYPGAGRRGARGWDVVDVVARVVEQRMLTLPGPGDGKVAVHVRHGSVRPRVAQWHRGYIPLAAYAAAASRLVASSSSSTTTTITATPAAVFASDDGAVYADAAFASFSPALLPLQEEQQEEEEGEEMRDGRVLVPGYTVDRLLQMSVLDRVQVGRRYLQELLVLAETAAAGENDRGGVVCGGASATCRLLAVMIGWEKAVVNERWVDVDGEMGWRGIVW